MPFDRVCITCGRAFQIRANRLAPFCRKSCKRGIGVVPLADRFWAKVAKSESCWLWRGGVNPGGYGTIFDPTKGHVVSAHRVAWKLTYGSYPELFVLHTCDVRHCVRPDHLWLGTQLDNMRDCSVKGRKRNTAQWSVSFNACVECGRTDRPHSGHGLCNTCFARRRRAVNRE